MQIQLTGLKQLAIDHQGIQINEVHPDWIKAEVLYCAVCRTDAKIWNEGHRDLILPRVPGHEMVVKVDDKYFVVWPGIACGHCSYCESGNENLCEEMKIIGFHRDGGFASEVIVPRSCLIAVPDHLSLQHACFAEPAGCIINAFRKLNLMKGETILIIGGGTVGLLAAAMASARGAHVTVIEKQESKIRKAAAFSRDTGIAVVKKTNDSKFNCVLNACADPLALLSGIPRLAKAGRFVHFSGLSKNEQMETNLLNLIHYKELQFSGSYGLTKADMENGLEQLNGIAPALDCLVEGFLPPQEVESHLQEVLDGKVYKYIIDFSNGQSQVKHSNNKVDIIMKPDKKSMGNTDLSQKIPAVDKQLEAAAMEKIDNKTKPLGSLGMLEKLAIQLSLAQNTLSPVIRRKALFVFAADHGIAEEGVSAFPQEVTGQMVKNFLNQGAAINVLCAHHNIDLSIVDVGVKSHPMSQHPALINRCIAPGTNNFALQAAMSKEQAEEAMKVGREVFLAAYEQEKIDVLGLGEMGIANTTSATVIISAITGKNVAACTGRGTGVDDQALDHKVEVIEKALTFHQPDGNNAMDVLTKVGGFEIAAMAGAALAAAEKRCVVVLDGLISTAAGLIAFTFNPQVRNYLVAGHKSVEQGHVYALSKMALEPVLDLQMRLGEGTGAALTINLLEAACKIMCDMASFDEAGVSGKDI